MLIVFVVMVLTVVMSATAMLAVFVVMVVLFLHPGQLCSHLCLTLHCLHQLGAGKLIPRCGNNGGLSIQGSQQFHCCIQLLLRDTVCARQNDGVCGFDLIIVKLAKVLHIDLDLAGIHHSHFAAQDHIVIGDLFHGSNYIRQLAHTGGLDHDSVRVIIGNHLGQRLAKITHQAATDTAGIHFGDIDTCILQKTAVNADLAEFIFDQHQLLPCIALGNHFLDKGGFTGA